MSKFLYPTGNYIISNNAKSILSGPGILEHLDKIITTKIIGSQINEIHDSIICHSNGRILDQLKIYILNNKAIIINNNVNGSEIRSQLVKGIPWNKKINVIDGDDAIISYRVVGTNITKILDQVRGVDKVTIVNNITPEEYPQKDDIEFTRVQIKFVTRNSPKDDLKPMRDAMLYSDVEKGIFKIEGLMNLRWKEETLKRMD